MTKATRGGARLERVAGVSSWGYGLTATCVMAGKELIVTSKTESTCLRPLQAQAAASR